MRTPLRLENRVFGSLTALRPTGKKDNNILWLCRCKCGVEREIKGATLISGNSQSCGIGACAAQYKHGHSLRILKSKEYMAWDRMQQRCFNEKCEQYNDYGGRGIFVCSRWLGDLGFQHFLADLGPKPSPAHSLDRFPDNNGNYEPGNVRWATRHEQALNKRQVLAIENFSDEVLLAEIERRGL